MSVVVRAIRTRSSLPGTISLPCESHAEAALIRHAVVRYRTVLTGRGIDLRNYAPHNKEGAGFGWDEVRRTAGEMSPGSTTRMSRRMVRAIHEALAETAHRAVNEDARRRARVLMARIDQLASPDGWICPNQPLGHDWQGDTVCQLCGQKRTVAEAIVSLLARLPGFSEERAVGLVARHATEATA